MMMTVAEILINRAKYLFMLNEIFHDKTINDLIDDFKTEGKITDIYTLEECQSKIKPTTFYIGLIKRLKNVI
jgi:hypothetical protein